MYLYTNIAIYKINVEFENDKNVRLNSKANHIKMFTENYTNPNSLKLSIHITLLWKWE